MSARNRDTLEWAPDDQVSVGILPPRDAPDWVIDAQWRARNPPGSKQGAGKGQNVDADKGEAEGVEDADKHEQQRSSADDSGGEDGDDFDEF